jgi:hypothetical protein
MDDSSESQKKKSSLKDHLLPDIPDFLKEQNEDANFSLTIRKEATINYDGRQFFVRIPSEISRFYRLKKGDKAELLVEADEDLSQNEHRKIVLSLRVIENGTK